MDKAHKTAGDFTTPARVATKLITSPVSIITMVFTMSIYPPNIAPFNQYRKLTMKNLLHSTALICLISASQFAQAGNSDGYLYDTRAVIVRDNYGNCVRTAEWNVGNAVKECDAGLFKTVAVTLPSAVAAAPALVIAPQPSQLNATLSADEAFDTNKAELKVAAKAKLSQLVKTINSGNYEKISITGHADRTGSARGNQSLSERRANAVHNYLVSEGLPASKLVSTGVGSSQPKTSVGDCAKLKGVKLRACLASDRRVDINVTGITAK